MKQRNSTGTQVLIGLVIAIVGAGLLLRKAGFPLPYWLFRWEMILIAIGLIIGIKNQFRDLSWLILVGIGVLFLSDDIFPGFRVGRYIFPVALIIVGVTIALNGRKTSKLLHQNPTDDNPSPDSSFTPYTPTTPSSGSGFVRMPDAGDPPAAAAGLYDTSDILDVTSVFGGTKRTVVSKNFMGGQVTSVLGGSDINLSNADIKGTITIEATSVLGGTKLIVPSDWDVQSQMVAVFGGVEDKRHIRPELINPNKKLILIGTSFLGGLEIKNY